MYDVTDMMLLISTLLVLVFSGIHIAVALGLASMLGIYLLTQDFSTMLSFVSNTGYEALRDYIFAVIPLFMLMGEFLAKCGAASDLFTLINRSTKKNTWAPWRCHGISQCSFCFCHWSLYCCGCCVFQNSLS